MKSFLELKLNVAKFFTILGLNVRKTSKIRQNFRDGVQIM